VARQRPEDVPALGWQWRFGGSSVQKLISTIDLLFGGW
jgi:hypothetical protein